MPTKNNITPTQLPPCPLKGCGGKAELLTCTIPRINRPADVDYVVGCTKCGLSTKPSLYKKSSINRWGNRHG